MGLLDDLTSKGEDLIDDKGEGWLDKVIDEGRDFVGGTALDPELAEVADKTLDKLSENTRPFLRLGKVGLGLVAGHLENDDENEAKRVYIATQATYEERRAFMQAAGDEAWDERKERDEAWEEVMVVLKEIGSIGLKVLIKVLRSSIGI